MLRIWDDDTGYCHTVWALCELYNSEIGFLENSQGGRFRCYEKSVRSNPVMLPLLPKSDPFIGKFPLYLEWIAENVHGHWAMEIVTDDPVPIGGGIGLTCISAEVRLFFEEADDALLCLLRFR